ncbi:arsenate reductase (glutaredoxin) [Gordonia sp. (in: high G+C Gram-positive bacteria)]|uniref:arsenate reductase (glutaredoxin) n=1 Tax=Gordonia sp. (in: high G+C Gram-positive bacteria) TaxID=84139 RepID=UPI003C763966
MDATIYYNPSCSKSRHALETLREAGAEVNVVEYLTDTPSKDELRKLFASAGLTARDAIRTGEPEYARLGLDDADDEALLEAMVAHPSLIQRPLVVTEGAVVMARTKESIDAMIHGLSAHE